MKRLNSLDVQLSRDNDTLVRIPAVQYALGIFLCQLSASFGLRAVYLLHFPWLTAVWSLLVLIIWALDICPELLYSLKVASKLSRPILLLLFLCIAGLVGKHQDLFFHWADQDLKIVTGLSALVNWGLVCGLVSLTSSVVAFVYCLGKPIRLYFRFLPLFFLVGVLVCNHVCLASGEIGQINLFHEMIKQEIGEPWRNQEQIMFLSRGLPAECKTSLEKESQVHVSVVSSGEHAQVQIIGAVPRNFSPSCLFAIVSQIRRAETEGLKLDASNLNRLSMGGILYLEFSVVGPQMKNQIEQWFQGARLVTPFSRLWMIAMIMITFCIMGLGVGVYFMGVSQHFNKRGT